MKIDILGTAQDGGCPHAGCYCDNCMKIINGEEKEKYPASLGISKDHYRILVEATPKMDIQLRKWQELNNYDSYLPDATIITHAHIGHYAGLMYLGKEVLNADNHPVYVTAKMRDFIESNSPYADLVSNGNIKLNILPIGESVKLSDSLTVKAIEVKHRNEHADTVGLLFSASDESVFFLPDIDSWDGFTKQLTDILSSCNRAYLDATFFNHDELPSLRGRDTSKVPHPTVEDTLTKIKEGIINTDKCEIHLIHFNHTNHLIHSTKKCLNESVYIAKQDI